MRISFLFWNMMKRPLQDRLAKMVSTHGADIVILAECGLPSAVIETALAQQTNQNYRLAPSNVEEKIRIFSRLDQSALVHQFSDYTGRLSIRTLHLPGKTEDVLLAVVHLPSRINFLPMIKWHWRRRQQQKFQKVRTRLPSAVQFWLVILI